ncbi:hypothetical protein BKA64DRAFT_664786 [Cadophora sp. MPI-SDFR-AT-0126]|nr:hypothetical protein BKA64DRAFT_664786 [Leotiomycetes sp. MPI-SDFR-AT-0126]
MTGFEVAGVILGLYPLIETAVNVFKATKTTGNAAASLNRRLTIERVIYRQFVLNLLASDVPEEHIKKLLSTESTDRQSWNDPTLSAKLSRRLGDNAEPILGILQELNKILSDLTEEFKHLNRGLEALAGLRSRLRVARQSLPLSSVQERLGQLRTLNGDLTRLMNGQPMNNTCMVQSSPNFPTRFLIRDCDQAKHLYELMDKGFLCDCNEPHIANFGLHRPSKRLHPFASSKIYKWKFDILFPPLNLGPTRPFEPLHDCVSSEDTETPETSVAVEISDDREAKSNSESTSSAQNTGPRNHERRRSVTILAQDHSEPNHNELFVEDLCSFIETLGMRSLRPEGILGLIGNSKKTYKLCTRQETSAALGSIICLEDLLKPGHRRLQRKERMQLAFRLSSAILQFSCTPWIDQSWTWQDFSALQRDEPQIALSQLFVSRKFYSARLQPASHAVKRHSQLGRYDVQPILTNLGFALIEIVLGRSLSVIGNKQSGESDVDLDLDLVKLQTAQALLKSGQIASEESQGYEDVVKACIHHQYRGRQDLQIKGIDSTDASFFDNVEEAILCPLYMECIKSWGAEPLDG